MSISLPSAAVAALPSNHQATAIGRRGGGAAPGWLAGRGSGGEIEAHEPKAITGEMRRRSGSLTARHLRLLSRSRLIIA
jgi:hypothetical protein